MNIKVNSNISHPNCAVATNARCNKLSIMQICPLAVPYAGIVSNSYPRCHIHIPPTSPFIVSSVHQSVRYIPVRTFFRPFVHPPVSQSVVHLSVWSFVGCFFLCMLRSFVCSTSHCRFDLLFNCPFLRQFIRPFFHPSVRASIRLYKSVFCSSVH